MKANNGIFIIDDFGRQLMSPRDLLNRWIVPLDRRVDYLTLRYGVKFQIPFELMVVFSTNLDPDDLADEAFLRRIHNKIYVEPVDTQTFDQIFQRVVTSKRIPAEPDSSEYLRKLVPARWPAGAPRLLPAGHLQHPAVDQRIREAPGPHDQGGVRARHGPILRQERTLCRLLAGRRSPPGGRRIGAGRPEPGQPPHRGHCGLPSRNPP